MKNRKTGAVLAASIVGLMSANLAGAQAIKQPDTRISVFYSPHKTDLSVKEYFQSLGQLPKDHSIDGNYYGLMAEKSFGKTFSIGADYLEGKSDTIAGASNFETPELFNPLNNEKAKILSLFGGYTVFDSPVFGQHEVAVGYWRMWARPAISAANWYDGIELGAKGRKTWENGFALTYRIGYVPDVTLHGYLKHSNAMEGKHALNYRFGAEIPVYKNFNVVGGYQKTKSISKVIMQTPPGAYGARAALNFSGIYIGAQYAF